MLQLNCRMSPSFSQSQLLLLRPPCPLVCPASNDPATNGTQPTNHIAHKPAQSPLIAPSSWPANPRMSPVRLQSLSKPPCIPIIPFNRRQTIYLHRRPPVLPHFTCCTSHPLPPADRPTRTHNGLFILSHHQTPPSYEQSPSLPPSTMPTQSSAF